METSNNSRELAGKPDKLFEVHVVAAKTIWGIFLTSIASWAIQLAKTLPSTKLARR